MPEKKVQIIEPTVRSARDGKKKLNVCAYARVSTDSDEQKDSFINQKTYYEAMTNQIPTTHLPAYSLMKQSAEQLINDQIFSV